MRILMASVALSALVLCSGCTTLQRYPSFGPGSGGPNPASGGGRIILFDRQAAPNLWPPSNSQLRAHPAPVAQADRVH